MSGIIVLLIFSVVGAGLIWLIAWAIYEACDGFDLNKSINKGVERGVAQALEAACAPGGAIDRAIWKDIEERARRKVEIKGPLTSVGFVLEVANEFIRVGSMGAKEARDLAASTVRQYLADEKIKFGDPAYCWDQDYARDLAHEYEIDHWEAA